MAALQRLIECPIAPLMVQADERGLLLVEFADTDRVERFRVSASYEPPRAKPGEAVTHSAANIRVQRHLDQFQDELKQYFDGDLKVFQTPVVLRGTEFQTAVWNELLKIPYGYTSTYEEIARKLGDEKKVRAVGQANGRNCLAIIVPCHRVIRVDGQLGGYGGGLWRKQRLLELESGALRLL